MPDSELVEILSTDGSIKRVATRAEMRAGRLRHRCTFVIVRSTAGEILIHKRSPEKDMWPSMWDMSCGGVVTAGESWDAAAARELSEEVGVRVSTTGAVLRYLGEGTYEDADVCELGRVWTATNDGPFTFNDGEVTEARFMSVSELAEHLDPAAATNAAQLDFVPDSAALAFPFLTVGNGGLDRAD